MVTSTMLKTVSSQNMTHCLRVELQIVEQGQHVVMNLTLNNYALHNLQRCPIASTCVLSDPLGEF